MALVETVMPGNSIGSVDARRLLHQILTRKVVAALLEHGDHGLRDGVSVNVVDVGGTGR